MPKKFSENDRDSFFEKIPNLKAAFGFEQKEIAPHFIDRIKLRIKNLFSYQESAPPLKGRVEEMLPKVDSVHAELFKLKNALLETESISDELNAFKGFILEPLIEEGSILKEKRKTTDPFQQVKIQDIYQIWLEKAEFWILSYKVEKKESFYRQVNEYIWKDFSSKVERDLKIVEDYIEHAVQALLVSDVEKKEKKLSIMRSVSEHIVALASLKRLPKEITFKELDEWNRTIDSEREYHFEACLSLVDRQVDDARPYATVDEHQHLLDVIGLINSIEEQTVLLKHSWNMTEKSSKEHELILQKAKLLAHEIHLVSLDLRLSPSILERLESIQSILDEIQ